MLRLADQGRLDELGVESGDEDLLDELGREGHHACVYVEAWLTAAYLDSTGWYTSSSVCASSQLPALVLGQAYRGFPCPSSCSGRGPDCDGCQDACEGGAHRHQALLSRLFAPLLSRRQRDAQRRLLALLQADVGPGPDGPTDGHPTPPAVGR
ncbi:hypothetical protein ACWCYY_34745 [Kitasatospora sp. NPDC001664]